MNDLLEMARRGFDVRRPYPLLQALSVMLAVLALARLAGWLISRVGRRLVAA